MNSDYMQTDCSTPQKTAEDNSIVVWAFLLAASLAVLLAACFAFSDLSSAAGAEPPVVSAVEPPRLDSKINPNTAPLASLMRLPGIGVARAASIVAYRDNLKDIQNHIDAFEECNDLQKISGIGPKTAQDLCPWLIFE